MKIKDGYLLDAIGTQKVAIAIDQNDDRFSGIIKLNSVGAFIWEHLQEKIELDVLIQAIVEKYDITYEQAEKDAASFLKVLEKNGILE